MTTFAELSSAATYSSDQIEEDVLAELQANNLPVSQWDDYSAGKKLVNSFSTVLAKYAEYIPTFAKLGLIEESEGEWLIVLGESNYQVAYTYATKNQRTLRITDVKSTVTPKTFAANSLWVRDNSGRKFVNASSVTVPKGSYVDAVFESELAGSDQNSVSSGWTFITGFSGATVTEPVVSIVQYAADDEDIEVYRQKLRDKVQSLGDGINDAKLTTWATTATSGTVTRTKARWNYMSGTVTPGPLTLYCATAAGETVSSPTLTTVRDYIQARMPSSILVDAQSVTVTNVSVSGTIYVPTAILTSARTEGYAALELLEGRLPIGANIDSDQVRAAALSGVPSSYTINADFGSPTSDTALSTYAVVNFVTSSLTYTGV